MKSAQPANQLHTEFVSKTLEMSRSFDVSVRNHISDGVFNVDAWWADVVAVLPTTKLKKLVRHMSSNEEFNIHFMPAITNELKNRAEACVVGEPQ